jgi:hypothetical protein
MWGQIAGAAIGALGSALGGSSAPQPPKFRPWSISDTSLGTTTFDRKNKQVEMSMSPTMGGFSSNFADIANQYMSGNSPTAGYQNWALNGVGGQIPGLFGGALDASQIDPATFARYDSQMGGLAGALGLGSGAASNYAALSMMGMAPGQAEASGMYGVGLGLLGERPQQYSDVAAQRLALLREQAAPFEQRAFNGLNQNLFNTGRMGSSGGALQTEAFARGLGQADTSRQLDSQGFAEQLYGRDLQAALARNQMGAGLMGQGMNGLFSGAGMGANYLNAAQSGYGMMGNIFGGQFGAGTMYNDLTNARAQQRLANAQDFFGFGNALSQQDLQSGQAGVQGYLGIADALQGQAQFGANMGAMGMGQASPASAPSPWGSFLQGLGGAVSGMNFGGSTAPSGYAPVQAGAPVSISPNLDFSYLNMPTLGG